MLGARSAEDDVVRAFDAGVDDYLASPWSDRTLVARIGAVLRRSDAPALAVVAHGDTVLDVAARRLLHGDSALPLTLLETGVLRALLARPGRVVTNGALATEAWGRSGPRERRSLKQTIYRLRQKLESESPFEGAYSPCAARAIAGARTTCRRVSSSASAQACWRSSGTAVCSHHRGRHAGPSNGTPATGPRVPNAVPFAVVR